MLAMADNENASTGSEVLNKLRSSEDPVDRAVAHALRSIQDSRAQRGERRSVGYEPRDINKYGTVGVIERRIRGEASGFNEVGPEDSYEAIVLKHPDRFAAEVVEIATRRLEAEKNEIAPTSDKASLSNMVTKILEKEHFPFPKGNLAPRQTDVQGSQFVRDPYIIAWVLKSSKGRCEACRNDAPFSTEIGRPFLEVHHVKPLGEGGTDRVSNAVALCPNCHRAMHHAVDAKERRALLFKNIQRLIAE